MRDESGSSHIGMSRLDMAVDAGTAAVQLIALSPSGNVAPLAMLGPVVVGLARLTPSATPLALIADRAVRPGALALAAGFGMLDHATALFALILLGGLLLRKPAD